MLIIMQAIASLSWSGLSSCPCRGLRRASQLFEPDAFEVEGDHYIAIITDGKSVIRNGTCIQMPDQKERPNYYFAGDAGGEHLASGLLSREQT
jgi:hypothetical protein